MAATQAELLIYLIDELATFEGRVAVITTSLNRHIADSRAFLNEVDWRGIERQRAAASSTPPKRRPMMGSI